jgi:hypothetical protein
MLQPLTEEFYRDALASVTGIELKPQRGHSIELFGKATRKAVTRTPRVGDKAKGEVGMVGHRRVGHRAGQATYVPHNSASPGRARSAKG